MPSQLTLGVILALLATVAGLGWYAKHQTERAAVAQSAIADAQAAAEAWQLALNQQTAYAKQQADKLAESAKGYDSLRKTTDKRIRDYEIAASADRSTHDWGAIAVPAYVSGRLCEYATDEDPGEGGVSATTPAVHGSDPNPCPGPDRHFVNRDLWRWAEQLIEWGSRLNADRVSLVSD